MALLLAEAMSKSQELQEELQRIEVGERMLWCFWFLVALELEKAGRTRTFFSLNIIIGHV